MKLLKQAGYMAATGFTIHPTIAFRSGLGPYKGQVLKSGNLGDERQTCRKILTLTPKIRFPRLQPPQASSTPTETAEPFTELGQIDVPQVLFACRRLGAGRIRRRPDFSAGGYRRAQHLGSSRWMATRDWILRHLDGGCYLQGSQKQRPQIPAPGGRSALAVANKTLGNCESARRLTLCASSRCVIVGMARLQG